MSFFHEEQICSSQFARTADTSGDWRIVSCRFLVAAVLIECENLGFRTPRRANSQFASCSHGRHTSGDRKSSSLCCCCSDWMLRISSSARNNLVSFDWLRTGADHLLILTYLLTYPYDSIVSTCFKEAADTNIQEGQI